MTKVFPARAGMSPVGGVVTVGGVGVPRSRGDEPTPDLLQNTQHRCSPRERG